jgi:hypothetical protein
LQRLKPKCDEPLSSLAFKFNLRRYSKALVTNELLALSSTLAD